MISKDQILSAERRLRSVTGDGVNVQESLRRNGILEKDTPERVAMRVERISNAEQTESRQQREGVAAEAREVPDATLALERVIGVSDLMSVSYLQRGVNAARTVGRVHIRLQKNGRLTGYGTGFMVGPGLLLTNNHVIPDADCGAASEIEFGYEDVATGSSVPSVFYGLTPTRFFVTNQELDFTLIGVSDPTASLTVLGWNPLIVAEGKVTTSECVSIIQHPEGQPKQVALRENRVVGILPNFVVYHTDTAPGSSGSPVFNDQWEVVALHHAGVPSKDANGNWLTRDRKIWKSSMGEQAIDWIANEGVRVSRIIQFVSDSANLSAAHRVLWEKALNDTPPTSSHRNEIDAHRAASAQKLPSDTTMPNDQPLPSGSSATWTIPVRVTVSVGDGPPKATIVLPLSGQSGTGEQPEPHPTQPTPNSSADGAATAQQDVERALTTLEASRRRKYYDRAADATAQTAYYRNLRMNNDSEGNYRTLSELVTDTHRDTPRYKPIVEVYPWVDLHPNNKIRSIYSGFEYDPETFIREDFEVEARREKLAESMRAGGGTAESAMRIEEALEAALPYNCEHVVPQSWFNKSEPMRGDLHHLFACESGCNSFRGNIPYFDFSEEEEAVRDKCGRREPTKFEPVDGKGVVARATMYFLLRYPGEINGTANEYESRRLATLIQWSEEFSVTEYERHRNAAIFERQGNRNPFIDHPEWVSQVDLSIGLG